MLGGIIRRSSGWSPSLLPSSLRVVSRSQAGGDCFSSPALVSDVAGGVADRSCEGGAVGFYSAGDRSSGDGVLGFGSRCLSKLASRADREVGILPLIQGVGSLTPSRSHGWPTQVSQVRSFVQLKTNLEVADNSGAKRVQCIKVMKGSNAAKIGDVIMASVKDAQPRGKVKKGEVVTCVVVRAATQKLRRDGSEIKFDKNAVVLVNKSGEPIGTRIFGPVPHELRRRKLVKILTLADYVA